MIQLYDHQKAVLSRLGNGKILWGGVGTGKSITAVAYYMQAEAPKDIFVITTAKKRDSLDWEKEFAKAGVGKCIDGTVAGLLRIDSWNNIKHYEAVSDAFFIFDEQRLVGDGVWVKSFLKIAKKNNWILLSATPGDSWLDYIPVFIANGFYRNRTEFKAEHVVYNSYSKFPSVARYTGVGRLVRHRNDILVEMPYRRHTIRHAHTVPVEYDQTLFDLVVKKRWNPFQNQPLRNVAELFGAMRKVVNSHSSRMDAVRNLMQKHPRMIVFYNFDYELHLLRSLMNTDELNRKDESCPIHSRVSTTSSPLESTSTRSNKILSASAATLQLPKTSSRAETGSLSEKTRCGCTFAVAEWNGHKHEPIPNSDRWVYLVQYAAGSEGWNCIETDTVVFYSLTYSYKMWHQAHGRIDRLNTPYTHLNYYTLLSNSIIDRAVMMSLRAKRSFNERALSDNFAKKF